MNDTTVIPLRRPQEADDPLTAILRSGARRLLAQAIKAEAEAFLATMKGVPLPDGRERLVRHGHGPERQVQTGIGPVAVRRGEGGGPGAPRAGGRGRLPPPMPPPPARRAPRPGARAP